MNLQLQTIQSKKMTLLLRWFKRKNQILKKKRNLKLKRSRRRRCLQPPQPLTHQLRLNQLLLRNQLKLNHNLLLQKLSLQKLRQLLMNWWAFRENQESCVFKLWLQLKIFQMLPSNFWWVDIFLKYLLEGVHKVKNQIMETKVMKVMQEWEDSANTILILPPFKQFKHWLAIQVSQWLDKGWFKTLISQLNLCSNYNKLNLKFSTPSNRIQVS